MGVYRQLRGPLVAAMLWIALAFASTALRDRGGAVLPLWLPTAVHVAALYATSRKRWPLLLATLFIAQFAYTALHGAPILLAFGAASANQVEALICAYLGIRVLGGRAKSPQTFAHVAGLFGAALLGCAVGTLLTAPFVPSTSIAQAVHWFLSSVLAVLTATPVMLYLRRWLRFGDQDVRWWKGDRERELLCSVAGMLVLGSVVLASPVRGLTPILFVAIVFAVFRYGQLAAACGVIAYAADGMIASVGGHSPAPYLDLNPATGTLLLQGQLLLMLANALPLAAMLLTRDRLEEGLFKSNDELRAHLTILNLTKTLAGIGRWQYNVETGEQNWSEKMLELNGLSPELAPDPGDIRHLLPDGGERLFSKLTEYRDARIPYSFEYPVDHPDGCEHILKMNVFNEFNSEGMRTALFAVAMDVTEQVRREEALKRAREQAIEQAAEAQRLAKTDPLTGLANRSAFQARYHEVVGDSLNHGFASALVLIDLDRFKDLNDTFGHPAGDACLCEVGRRLHRAFHSAGLAARLGGDEFAIILRAPTDPARIAHVLQQTVVMLSRPLFWGGLRLEVSASIGAVLVGRPHPRRITELFAEVDIALYAAKAAGRNRVHLFGDEGHSRAA